MAFHLTAGYLYSVGIDIPRYIMFLHGSLWFDYCARMYLDIEACHMYKYIQVYHIMRRCDIWRYMYTWNIQGYVHDIYIALLGIDDIYIFRTYVYLDIYPPTVDHYIKCVCIYNTDISCTYRYIIRFIFGYISKHTTNTDTACFDMYKKIHGYRYTWNIQGYVHGIYTYSFLVI